MIWHFGSADYRSFQDYRRAVLQAIALDLRPTCWIWQIETIDTPVVNGLARPWHIMSHEEEGIAYGTA